MGRETGTVADLGRKQTLKVLVTGHRGYIGSVLVPMLLERGHEVRGIDAGFFSDCTFGAMPDPAIPDHYIDVRDLTEDHVAGYDAIIHLAGLSNDPLGDYDPSLTESINTMASVRLAKMAKQVGVRRFLFASSCSNYGASGNDFLDETGCFNPVTPYGVSKVQVEQQVLPLADATFSPTFLRASTAYGLSPRIRFDLVVNNLTAWAYTTGEVFLKSDGSAWRPVVHVEDIARAYTAVLEADRQLIHAEAFNVGNTTENYRVIDIARMVEEIVPDCRLKLADTASADSRCYRVDCNRIARVLQGFKPQWTARRGIESLYEAFSSSDLTVAQFEGETYNRIDHVKMLVRTGVLDKCLKASARLDKVGT